MELISIGIGFVAVLGVLVVYALLAAVQEAGDRNACPSCGGSHLIHIWDAVWMCKGCGCGLLMTPSGAEYISDESLLEALKCAIRDVRNATGASRGQEGTPSILRTDRARHRLSRYEAMRQAVEARIQREAA